MWGGMPSSIFQSFRIEDAYPAYADAFCPCREPEILYGAYRGIDCRLRHEVPAQTMPSFAHRVAGDAYILRRLQNAFELQATIEISAFTLVGIGCYLLRLGKEAVHCAPHLPVTNHDEAPRLHKADRWRVVRGSQEPQQNIVSQGLG